MAYADYIYYLNVYHGTQLTKDEFDQYAVPASAYVDRLLFNRLSTGADITDAVKNAVCAVTELEKAEAVQFGESSIAIKSETVDGDSVTYASAQEIAYAWEAKKKSLVELYIPACDPLRGRWI